MPANACDLVALAAPFGHRYSYTNNVIPTSDADYIYRVLKARRLEGFQKKIQRIRWVGYLILSHHLIRQPCVNITNL
jgi:hypothetical protein